MAGALLVADANAALSQSDHRLGWSHQGGPLAYPAQGESQGRLAVHPSEKVSPSAWAAERSWSWWPAATVPSARRWRCCRTTLGADRRHDALPREHIL